MEEINYILRMGLDMLEWYAKILGEKREGGLTLDDRFSVHFLGIL
jgi:hypothetical protein